jgi:hypothetical protein
MPICSGSHRRYQHTHTPTPTHMHLQLQLIGKSSTRQSRMPLYVGIPVCMLTYMSSLLLNPILCTNFADCSVLTVTQVWSTTPTAHQALISHQQAGLVVQPAGLAEATSVSAQTACTSSYTTGTLTNVLLSTVLPFQLCCAGNGDIRGDNTGLHAAWQN